ncbi:MAG TPA: bifunctional [glutamine synthetase] adenylyltransferase/[glutamine synthetase]-adenylyl-L-tyrosine phosphorylase [Hyphomicrobiaceae bacterium]|nr:bifunctional [glutamine synthetase] adenylyltransferase/[glutamine synthetase]-adenylyl-L-tyrosine phosphorylase [Hyphomicrobiaceae bacterium]
MAIPDSPSDPAPLHQRLAAAPVVHDAGRASGALADLAQRCAAEPQLAQLGRLVAAPAVRDLLFGIFGASPYLTGLIERDPVRLQRILASSPERRFAELVQELPAAAGAAQSMPDAMRVLREFKAEVALLIALADIGGAWEVMTATRRLSEAADAAVSAAVGFLFRRAHAKGDWLAPDPAGYIVLAMGKHGAFELNYSSDIDLIVFYDLAQVRVRPGLEVQPFLVRLTRDLVRLLQERTEHGYVFRTDLRLRPDPGSTPLAISTDAALNYYESVGQNWERAAMIKARAVAGDIAAGEELLYSLAPFVWRKYLDFAAIADIHAMKRQIHAVRGFGQIAVAGHDIKVGRGGIREIEFFAQTQQLIAGGRQPALRASETLVALERLATAGWITAAVRNDLDKAYCFLRTVEHRLQMVADEQTQRLPDDPEQLLRVARFCGFADAAAFSARLTAELECVQAHYARLFEHSPALTRGGANMVFAGEADDPGTLETLARMGYARPSDVIAGVRAWHHGRYPAVHAPRARELLTEVQPALIEALSKTANPDLAFVGFNRFLAELPSGVQLFSLLKQHPALLGLIAAIMGTAPRLSRLLSKRRRVLDAVLTPGFFGAVPSEGELRQIIAAELDGATDFEDVLDRARRIVHEQTFLIGVRVLTGSIGAAQAGGAYAQVAECMIGAIQAEVEREMARTHGQVPGGAMAVVAMGKLGGREMTAASDLDLIIVYDFDAETTMSDGPRPLAPTHYYTRLAQRLLSALTAPTSEGNLYDVDMRLRPSGQKGPLATQLSSFVNYQQNEAWTWEHLALTRARVISGPPNLRAAVEAAILSALTRTRDVAKTAQDVREMRALIEREKGSEDIWELKQVRGGLVDLEFMAQYLQLVHGHAHPEVLSPSTTGALINLERAGLLSAQAAEVLLPAALLFGNLTQVLRLCLDGPFVAARADDGLKALLVRAGEAPDFARLEADLAARQAAVASLFNEIVV